METAVKAGTVGKDFITGHTHIVAVNRDIEEKQVPPMGESVIP